MDRELGKEYAQGEERRKFLANNSDGTEKKSYMRSFTPEELLKQKEELSEVSISINDIEEELSEVKKTYKEQLKPMYEMKQKVLKNLRDKAELVEEECYKIVDVENREVGYYNENGDLVESRPVYRDELQLNLFRMPEAKTGTYDE